MKSKLLISALTLGLAASAWSAGYQPVPLTPGSFNADVVVEKTAAPPIENFFTAGGDGGTNLTGNAWFETGFYPSVPLWGLPPHGTSFYAQTQSNAVISPDTNFFFTMPPDYTTNNVLFVSGNNGPRTATITISNPANFVGLSLLESSGNGNEVVTYTLHHADSSIETNSFVSPDWFRGTNTAPFYPAWNPHCLISVEGGNLQQINGNNGSLFHNEIQVINSNSPVTSIDFSIPGTGGRMSLFAISASTDGVSYTNSLTLTGFNEDVIAESNAPNFSMNVGGCTATMERGTNQWGKVFYETGFAGRANTEGLPPAGTTFTNIAGNHSFTLAPSYTSNNAMLIAGSFNNGLNGTVVSYGPSNGTFTLTAPTAYQSISLLSASSFGPKFIDVTVNHADLTSETFTGVSLPDWFNTGGTIAPANNNGWGAVLSLQANNGFEVDNSTFGTFNVSNYRLFGVDVPLGNTTSPVTSIDFAFNTSVVPGNAANTSAEVAFIFAVAGSTNGTNFFPAPVTGYNADMVIEKTTPLHPHGLYNATTVSMDGGTNNTGNTWYERGYYKQFPNTGLPPAGSTISSIAQPNNSYQMPATYTGNNAAFIDAVHTNANLTLATPAAYTSLSILSSDANGIVSNRVIMQYMDGTSDTNTFISQDWFNNNPFAFSSLGRLNLDSPAINNDPGHTTTPNPRLYEAQFGLNNTNSPLTNVLIQFTGAANLASGREVVLAVSGNTGSFASLLRSATASPASSIEGSTLTLTATTAGGTAPITYNWQVSSNGTFVNLVDGVAGVSGSSTLVCTIATYPGWLTNAGTGTGVSALTFRLQASNVAGTVVSPTTAATLFSGYPDLPAPGDTIAAFGGTTGDAGPPGNIDDFVGGTPDVKCLWHSPNANPVNVGFTTTPSVGSSVARGMRLYTANDTQGRDPLSVMLDGSNDGGNTWVNILPQTGVTLPAGRNNTNSVAPNPLVHFVTEVDFYANIAAYTSYRVTFPTVNTPSLALVQIGEVEIVGQSLNTAPPFFTAQPPPTETCFVGASPTFTVTAGGAPTLHYQWFSNNIAISGATTNTFKLVNAKLSNSGNTFYCNVNNINGTTNSVTNTLTVLPLPTNTYPLAVLADNPIAYYRMDEAEVGGGDNGVTCNDYVGGNFGYYSNAVLGVAGYNSNDVDTAALFGNSTDSGAFNIPISFAKPSGQNGIFSVEAWVQGIAGAQGTDAGIITVGYGGFEQFNLDCGGNDPAHDFRFYVRDVTGVVHGPSGTKAPSDGLWHHVVGVCDEANSNVVLYVDGIQSGITTGLANGLGILGPTTPMSIGSRRQNTTSDYNFQFQGTVDEVAIYNTALTPAKVLAHYFASQPAPLFIVQPTNTTVGEGATLKLFSAAYGPGTLSYQWADSPDGTTFTPLGGQTSSNLTIANISASLNGYFFQVTVTNANGSVTSTNAQVTVVSGPPQIVSDLPNSQIAIAGSVLTLQVTAFGTPPLVYQWQSSPDGGVTWNNLANSGRISGVTTSALTVANVNTNDAIGYRVSITNGFSAGNPTVSTADLVSVQSGVNFNTDGTGWQIQGTIPPFIVNNVLTITDNGQGENGSAYLKSPVNITGPFEVQFTYQVVAGVPGSQADGACFVIHNDPRGASVLSGGGGTFGISGVAPSAELELNIYTGAAQGVGFSFNVNGNLGYYGTGQSLPTTPVVLDNGHHIDVVFTYLNNIGSVTLTERETGAQFHNSFNLNTLGTTLPAIVGGNTAYVGFSGADGGVAAYQQVSNFRFFSIVGLNVNQATPGQITLSWPPQIGNYVLQSTSSLASPNWQPVNATINYVNGLYQVTVPNGGGNAYYRLALALQ